MGILSLFRKKLPKNKIAWCIGIPYTKDLFIECYNKPDGSDFIDSLEFKYGTNNKDILWKRYKSLADKIRETIASLRTRNVLIIDLTSIDDLKLAYSCSNIIITAHRHRYLNCLDFMGNTISIEDVIRSIPAEYDGAIDISSCYSASFQMAWKKYNLKTTYFAADTKSSIELRLFIYRQLVTQMIAHPNRDYGDCLYVILKRIDIDAIGHKNRRDNVYLGDDINKSSNIGDTASLFAPKKVKRDSDMLIQVFIYDFKEHEKVFTTAYNYNSSEYECIPLNFDIAEGDKITVSLNIRHLPELKQVKSIVWRGRASKVSFVMTVPQNYERDNLIAEIVLVVNGIALGDMVAFIKVTENHHTQEVFPDIIRKKYEKVFISYSHLDEEKVKYLDVAYSAIGVNHFFDRKSLKTGDIYPKEIKNYIDSADVFILCWSQNAQQSSYVRKELEEAIKRAYPNVQDEKTRIRIFPLSIEPRVDFPPEVNDYYNYENL